MYRRLAVLTAPLLAVLAFAIPAAHAGSGDQYCYGNACLTALQGGPFVGVQLGSGLANNDFTLVYEPGTGNYYLKFTGNSSWAGHCVGDAYNLSTRADTSLDTCPGSNGGGGWGTNLETTSAGCPSGQIAFYDIHWGGWLSPAYNYGNGSPFYLNGPKTCYFVLGAA
jgi:hypothetical protein